MICLSNHFPSLFSYESQSIISAFNPQASASSQLDPHMPPTIMPWLSTAVPGQQPSGNPQTPYTSSANQYMINTNQDNYLTSLGNFHQPSATHPSFPTQYWSPVATTLMFPAPPQSMLAQQQPLNNEQQSPQSKGNDMGNRPGTPSNSTDLLSSSQPNQQTQFINMSRAAQPPSKRQLVLSIEHQHSSLLSSEFSILCSCFTHISRSTFNDANITTTNRFTRTSYVSTTSANSK